MKKIITSIIVFLFGITTVFAERSEHIVYRSKAEAEIDEMRWEMAMDFWTWFFINWHIIAIVWGIGAVITSIVFYSIDRKGWRKPEVKTSIICGIFWFITVPLRIFSK